MEKNKSLAFKCFLESANHGFAEAQFELGKSYANGIGVQKDNATGCEWLMLSAQQGHQFAIQFSQDNSQFIYQLAQAYTLEKQLKKANEFYQIIANYGNSPEKEEAVRHLIMLSRMQSSESSFKILAKTGSPLHTSAITQLPSTKEGKKNTKTQVTSLSPFG